MLYCNTPKRLSGGIDLAESYRAIADKRDGHRANAVEIVRAGVAQPVQFVATACHLDYRNGALVKSGNIMGIIAAPNITPPAIADTLRINGNSYTITDLQPIAPTPGASVAQFAIEARR